MDEYEADRYAAQLADSRHVAEALVNIEVKARFLESSFWTPTEKHYLILGIVRKQFLIESGYADQKLIELLTTNLQPPAQTYIAILNHWKLSHLRKKIRQIDQSLILQR